MRALIGQTAMVYCAGKLMEKSHVFQILLLNKYFLNVTKDYWSITLTVILL